MNTDRTPKTDQSDLYITGQNRPPKNGRQYRHSSQLSLAAYGILVVAYRLNQTLVSGSNHFGSFLCEPKCSSEPKGSSVPNTLCEGEGNY